MARPAAAHGVLATMPGEYMLFGVGAAPDGAAERTVRAQLDAMLQAMAAHASGMYLDFTEHRVDRARL